eukprot:354058-Chlamydomonas_euryale.AAC.13
MLPAGATSKGLPPRAVFCLDYPDCQAWWQAGVSPGGHAREASQATSCDMAALGSPRSNCMLKTWTCE